MKLPAGAFKVIGQRRPIKNSVSRHNPMIPQCRDAAVDHRSGFFPLKGLCPKAFRNDHCEPMRLP